MFALDVPRSVMSLIVRCEQRDLVNKLVGLSLFPEYQSNYLRIITLIKIALVKSCGSRRATWSDLKSMLNLPSDHEAFRNEDPAEDVFVTSVSLPDGEFRIFNGVYAAADLNLQRLLDAVFSQDFASRDRLMAECRALLTLSDQIAERCGFAPGLFAQSTQWNTKWPSNLPKLVERGQTARFSCAGLAEIGLSPAELSAFVHGPLNDLLSAVFGKTSLNLRPLLHAGDEFVLPIPSLVSPAIRLHLSHRIADGTIPREAAQSFHTLQQARWLLREFPARHEYPLQQSDLELPRPDLGVPSYSQAVIRFDEDKAAHIVVIEADWTKPPRKIIEEGFPQKPRINQALSTHVHECFASIKSALRIERGLTLVIYDSPGWVQELDAGSDLAEEWHVRGLSASTLTSLLDDPLFSLLDLWKMLRGRKELDIQDVRFTAWPDLLNYWSIWRAFGGTFWPKEADPRKFGNLYVPTEFIQAQLANSRGVKGSHALPLPSGEWLRVERWVDVGAPAIEYEKPIFISPLAAIHGESLGVAETSRGPWWVVNARPPTAPEERRYLFLLWQSALEWLLLLADNSGERLGTRHGPLQIRLLPVPESITDAPTDIEYVRAPGSATVTVILPPNFIENLVTPDNSGEKRLVYALAQAVAMAWDTHLDDAQLGSWVNEVTKNPDLKMMHVTLSGDAGLAVDLLLEKKQSLRLLQRADIQRARIHTRDRLIAEGVIAPEQRAVEGAKEVTRLLNRLVDIRWRSCRLLLKELDRTQLLMLVSRLIEAIHRDRVEGERAALARSHHYADSPDADIWAQASTSQRDGAFRSYRVLAEMAICEAPLTGGRAPGLSDVDMLVAEISQLILEAELSDAVRSKLAAPAITFSPKGALEATEGGIIGSMQEYLLACIGEVIAKDMDAYPALFEQSEEPDHTEFDTDPIFEAYEAEFELSMHESAQICSALLNISIETASDVVVARRSDVQKLLVEKEIDPKLFERFLAAFGLQARPEWDVAPKPYSPSDVYPWLFERRLSLMLKPVLVTSDQPDPFIIYGVRQLEMGCRYASHLLESGTLQPDKVFSDTAKAYVNAEVNQRGDEFEKEVASSVKAAEWRTFPALPMTRFGAPSNFGDLDVLAVSPDYKTWVVIECKWFGAARTPREIANWLQDFLGQEDDKLHRHLRRHQWIDTNRQAVARSLKIPEPTTVFGRIATTTPVPLAFTDNLPPQATVWTRREFVPSLKALQ